jgi:hypothetical protein
MYAEQLQGHAISEASLLRVQVKKPLKEHLNAPSISITCEGLSVIAAFAGMRKTGLVSGSLG